MGVQVFSEGEGPCLDDYIPLFDYQQQTPASYDDAKPRLHALATSATVKLVPRQWTFGCVFMVLTMPDLTDSDDDCYDVPEMHAAPPPSDDGFLHCPDIDVWVGSEYEADKLFLSRPAVPGGVAIDYQSMPIAAVQGNTLYLQLRFSDEDSSDDEITFMEVRIVADTVEIYDQAEIANRSRPLNPDGSIRFIDNVATRLHRAIAACHEENPDPPAYGEEGDAEAGGEMGEDTRPGAGGWITSENMHEFMDENGNLRMPDFVTTTNGEEDGHADDHVHEHDTNGRINLNGHYEEQEVEPLGPGAGRTRTAAEAVEDGTLEEAERPGPSGSG